MPNSDAFDQLLAMADSLLYTIFSDADWNEADHPRASDGKFGNGSGSSKPKMSPREKTEVERYSGDHFFRLNQELRSGDASNASVPHLDSAISKSEIPNGQKIYRGMTRDAAKSLFGSNVKVGAVISDKAFLSTSKSKHIAKMNSIGGVMLEIEPKDGAKGLDVSAISENKHEEEVLLPRDAKMKVLGIKAPKSPLDPVIVRVSYE